MKMIINFILKNHYNAQMNKNGDKIVEDNEKKMWKKNNEEISSSLFHPFIGSECLTFNDLHNN